jgi:hypothetical protein
MCQWWSTLVAWWMHIGSACLQSLWEEITADVTKEINRTEVGSEWWARDPLASLEDWEGAKGKMP